MEITIQLIIDTYKEELSKVMNENILLKAQLRQLQIELNSNEESDE